MKIKIEDKNKKNEKGVKVRIVRPPIVDTIELRRIIFSRARALVL